MEQTLTHKNQDTKMGFTLGWGWKLPLMTILGSLWGFFGPVQGILQGIGILVILDIVSGVAAQFRDGEHKITSRRFFKKIPKLVALVLGVSGALVAAPHLTFLGGNGVSIAKWLCSIYGVYELLSILENCGRLGLPGAAGLLRLLRERTGRSPENPESS